MKFYQSKLSDFKYQNLPIFNISLSKQTLTKKKYSKQNLSFPLLPPTF